LPNSEQKEKPPDSSNQAALIDFGGEGEI